MRRPAGGGRPRGDWHLTVAAAAVVLGAAAVSPQLVTVRPPQAAGPAGQDGPRSPVAGATGDGADPASGTTRSAASPTGPPTASTSPDPSTPASSGPATRPRPSSPRPAFRPVKVAASDPRNRIDGAKVIECVPCASGSRVQYLGQGHTLVVPLRDVAVAGERRLTIVYQSAELRRLFVGVGDAEPLVLELAGAGDWETPARVTVTVFVPAGDVDLKFYNTDEPAPDLDQVVLR